MAQAALSATENALENQRIGGLQIRVAALCTVVQVCDGHDINSIGMAVPSLTHAWNLAGPAFSQAFIASSVGILVGALFAFITSFDELVVALFISGSGAVTLPRRMWDNLLYQIEPTIAAVSTLTIVLTVVLMGCAHLLRKRTPV